MRSQIRSGKTAWTVATTSLCSHATRLGGRVALASLIALLSACQRPSHEGQAVFTARPSPTPSPEHCWLYDKMYPATKAAYVREHLSLYEQREVENWAEMVPLDERAFVRWMRAPWISPPVNEHGPFVVFVYSFAGSHAIKALNGNVLVNFNACQAFPYPP